MGDLLKNLALDAWYKVLMYVGLLGIVAALIFDIKVITNTQLLLLSVGIFLFGLGEWMNQKSESFFKDANAYTGPAAIITRHYRKQTLLGSIFQGLSILSLILGLLSIYRNV